MNEADTPNNGAFIEPVNSADVPQQASCPFYSVLPIENRTNPQLPLLAPAENKQCQEDASCQDSMRETNRQTEVTSNSERILQLNQRQLDKLEPSVDWVAEPGSEEEALIDSEFKKLLVLNEELRSANTELYEQVEGLKATLSESETALQWQKRRSTVTEAMLNQQAQELTAAQEQIKSLFQQLETSLSTVQTQETAIENYKSQLEINQQRLALLERECTFIQTKYNEQSHQLLQSETACRELRTRLMRQQRQTLQFKAALEKCLETPVPSYDSTDNVTISNDIGSRRVRNSKRNSSLFANPKPIQPWSVEPESDPDDTDIYLIESTPPSPQKWDHLSSAHLYPANTTVEENTPISELLTPESEIDDSATEKTASANSSNLDEQIENLIQSFFASQTTSASLPLTEKDVENTEDIEDVENNDEAATVWETVVIPVENDHKEPTITISFSPDTDSEENTDYWSDASQLPLPEQPFTDNSTHPNPPSPLIYPERPPKGRKSLASVELPKFRPKS